jgi:hypothetical protein
MLASLFKEQTRASLAIEGNAAGTSSTSPDMSPSSVMIQ